MNRTRDEEKAIRLQLLESLARVERLEQQLRDTESTLARTRASEAEVRGSTAFALGMAVVRSLRAPRTAPREIATMTRRWMERRRQLRAAIQSAEAVAIESAIAPATAPVAAPAPLNLVSLEAAADRPAQLKQLRIAAVLDQFSHETFAPDCELLALRRSDWAEQLRAFRPHLVLVESAWRGLDGDWEGFVAPCSSTLRELVASCRAAGIPTAFWNKEDPLHFEAFIEAAALFDTVFTTDAACIPRYRRELKHPRVYCMPFALQPAMFHPIAEQAREPAFFFAGAYYGNLLERARDFRNVADALRVVGPLTIFDRNHGKASRSNSYPQAYRGHVRGGVPYEAIPALYRQFAFGVNLNTVKQSPTMFARRVFELIGSGCAVYGNFSLGVRRLLGNLVVASDDQIALFDTAWSDVDPARRDAATRRAQALRKVLNEHTSAHRLAYLCEKTLSWTPALPALPKFVVVARVRDEQELQAVIAAYRRQHGVDAELIVDVPARLAAGLPEGVVALSEMQRQATPASQWHDCWVAPFHPQDGYGQHYLFDIALATTYTRAAVIGKAAYVQVQADRSVLRQGELEYRSVDNLALRRAAFHASVWSRSVDALFADLDQGTVTAPSACAIDALSYVEGSTEMDAAPPCDEGVSMRELLDQAQALPPAPALEDAHLISGPALAAAFNQGAMAPGTSATPRRHRLELCSTRRPGAPVLLKTRLWTRAELERDGHLRLWLDAHPAADVRWGVEALDHHGSVLAHYELPPQVTLAPALSDAATHLRFTVALDSPLVTQIDAIQLRACEPTPLLMCGSGRLLVVTNAYPSREHAYRNAFVHRRVDRYRRLGMRVDVVVARRGSATHAYDFEGVTVTQCDPDVLAATLRATRYDAVAIHFLDRDIWDAVAATAEHTSTVVWVHGADIQPWTRRSFNYTDATALASAQRDSDARQAFWREVFSALPAKLHFVLVSALFAEQCWEDLGIALDASRWSVVHNPIDTELFGYVAKEGEQRLKILSLRPHASRIYANDLVAETIGHLAQRPDFASLHFTLIGEGPLWEQDFAGLAKYSNVELQRRFVHQADIPALHREHGIFLVPTRGDTQGVSRDEAMASGLVPVTCAVGAVPEFVDAQCGMLCPAEDAEALAQAVARLVDDPQLFLRLSRNAAQRVRAQSDADTLVRRELALLGLLASDAGAAQTASPAAVPTRIAII